MATYYVDPDATGAEDGTSWEDAWLSITDANSAAVVAAGDTVYVRGTLTAQQDWTTSGTATDPIFIVGCDADGTEKLGSYAVIDRDGGAGYGLNTGCNYVIYRNLIIQNAASHGVYNPNSGSQFIRCKIIGNGGDGMYGTNDTLSFYECDISNNVGIGLRRPGDGSSVWYCKIMGNGSHGIELNFSLTVNGTIIHNNAGSAIDGGSSVNVSNSVIDGNAIGINSSYGNVISTTRLTNNTGDAIDGTGYAIITYNFMSGNGGTIDPAMHNSLGSIGTGNETTGVVGYNDRANDDFNLTSDATLRRFAMPIGASGDTNNYYGTAGLSPDDAASGDGGGGTKSRSGTILGIKRGGNI